MSNKIRRAATELVDLILGREEWSKVTWLHIDNLNIFLAAVLAAGFDARAVRKGQVLGYFRGRYGEMTFETYPINTACPFKVIHQDGSDHRIATTWLVSAVQNVRMWRDLNNYSREDIIAIMMAVIEDSIPLRPIRLTHDDDYLCEYTRKDSVHIRDVDDVDDCVGVHRCCGGWVKRRRQSETYDQLVCSACPIRILFPKEIRSYGELRRYLKEDLAAKPGLIDRFFIRVSQLL